ncbi:sigma-70 family RNA polymerase sigma factor [Actinokineospora sp. PR83]|uniref:sigma-70 family RNA polymerase sigma factor n=1 Tax=Actinokineospora sp. PR83 TaxID=2884908 RepID=UPI001F166F76|nr:sigma-70 family RNA polymerase sigma factor [Actinokineospora sp. PR83]MCG8917602.1 sigma-70 family RNA polymerase sigma factor [Actinokineospora sp. PR83]
MTGDDRPAAGGYRDGAHDEAELSAATCEDRALLRRLRAGEDAAFGELFSRHCDAVRRLARGMVTDRAEAEDLTAEAFFRVLQAIRRGSGPVDNVRGYLLIVVRRVAWEWAGRRRDVPVTDEELDYRAGPELDDPGRSTERSLITRAFTSLPERWRSVLWKVEVEGERPAVVAGKFGLSPNATAALARRARQGLRAAYLQAHLTTERGSVGCRAALEKLGAYTAGSIKGTERRKVRAHLQVCPSCTDMQAELQDVCAGLRAHAAFLAVPVAGLALAQQAAAPTGAGLLAGVKAVLTGVKFQVTAAAASAAAVGAFTLLPLGHVDGQPDAFADLDGTAPTLVVTSGSPAPAGTTRATTPPTAASSAIRIDAGHHPSAEQPPPAAGREPERERTAAQPVPPVTAPAPTTTATTRTPEGRDEEPTVLDAPVDDFDDTLPVVSRQVSHQRKWWVYDQYDVISEVSTTTLVNAADQTTVSTSTSEYTRYRAPGGTAAPTPVSSRDAPEAPTVTRTPSG